MERVRAKAKTKAFANVLPHVDRIDRDLTLAGPAARVASWMEDKSVADVAALPSVLAAAIPTEWIKSSRYGGVIYSEHRCAWVHEFTSDMADRSPAAASSMGEPTSAGTAGER